MSRITTSRAALVLLAVAALAVAGCAKKYAQQSLGKDGPVAQEIGAMVAALRSAGPEGLDQAIQEQAAGGLTAIQERSLRASLSRIATADAAELEDLSRFGRNVYRASLRLRSGGGTSATVCMLLVHADGRLRWAGQN